MHDRYAPAHSLYSQKNEKAKSKTVSLFSTSINFINYFHSLIFQRAHRKRGIVSASAGVFSSDRRG